MRRTVLTVTPPAGVDTSHWPMTLDIEENFYFKPDAGRLLVSPADETPMPPCDVQPDELDIAIAIDRLMRATTIEVARVERKWAGLRSFVSDKTTVNGFDPLADGFFWLAGQGGYGIQTAEAMARCAVSLIECGELADRYPRRWPRRREPQSGAVPGLEVALALAVILFGLVEDALGGGEADIGRLVVAHRAQHPGEIELGISEA